MARQQYKVGTFNHKLFTSGQKWIYELLITLVLVEFSNSSITCGPGIYSPGGTTPSGKIFIDHDSNTPLEIACVLNPNHELLQKVLSDDAAAKGNKSILLSQRIRFYKNEEFVPNQYVSIINSTAAQLRVPNPPVGSDVYTCMVCVDKNNHCAEVSKSSGTSIKNALQKNIINTIGSHPSVSRASHDDCIGVCFNNVIVGYKPLKITNFSCISNNWESLSCNWTKPENPIQTTYKLYFRLRGRSGSSRAVTKCPTDSDVKNNTCYWDLSTPQLYRQSHEYYFFVLIGENQLGNSSTTIPFHHYANIIPAKPTKIAVADKTETSIKLSWSLDTMSFYSHGLIYKIQYKSQWDRNPEHWNSISVSDNCTPQSTSQTTSVEVMSCLEQNGTSFSFNITGLEYPFTRYDFRMYVRTALAVGDDKWSAPACFTANTKSTIPKRPPRTDIGSFEYVISPTDKSKRDIVIYWQTIEENEQCGESFGYVAYYIKTTEDQQISTCRSNEIRTNHAKFDNLSTSIGYEFIILSYNEEGSSIECSRVYVPGESDTLNKPVSFKKNVFDKQGIFELSWKDSDSQELFNENQRYFYTLFWCEKDVIDPRQCSGYMNWMHVPISVSRYNTTLLDDMDKYIFAISVNSENQMSTGIDNLKTRSSGMMWESFNDNVKNVWVSVVGSTFVGLSWKVYCDDDKTGLVGYHIFYCPIVSINNSLCRETMTEKTVKEVHGNNCEGSVLVSNLRPYTAYLIAIAIVTSNGETLKFDISISTLNGPILK